MMALSIRQPWAWLIIHGGKDIENRTWKTVWRGRFLIHASKGMLRAEYEEAERTLFLAQARLGGSVVLPAFEALDRGGVIGAVDLVGCARVATSPWFFGPYGYVLANPEPLRFLPHRGRLGFFDIHVPPQYARQEALA